MDRASFATLALLIVPTSLLAQSKLSGFVISLETGKPVPGAIVSLKDASGLDISGRSALHTDQSGYYEFSDLGRGSYQLRVGSMYDFDDEPVRNVLVSSTFPVADSAHVYVGLSELGSRSQMALTRRIKSRDTIGSPADRFALMFFRSSMKDDSGRELLTSEWAEDPDSGVTLQ